MPIYYNLTNVTEANTFFGIYQGIDTVSGGLLSAGILCTIWIVLFVIGKSQGYDTKVVMIGNSFICTVFAGLMMLTSNIGTNLFIYPMILLVVAILAKAFWD
jgi:hypothetical protein